MHHFFFRGHLQQRRKSRALTYYGKKRLISSLMTPLPFLTIPMSDFKKGLRYILPFWTESNRKESVEFEYVCIFNKTRRRPSEDTSGRVNAILSEPSSKHFSGVLEARRSAPTTYDRFEIQMLWKQQWVNSTMFLYVFLKKKKNW
jgi:hypothetical protein